MKLMISARDSQIDSNVKYIKPYREYNIKENISVFTIQKLEEEVKYLNKNKINKLKKICSQTLTTATTFFTTISPTLATSTPQMITQSDILAGGMTIIGIMAVASFVLTIILLQSAAGYKMILRKKKKEANEWSIEIIKGFIQIMIAPALISTIALVMYLLFGNLTWFVNPLNAS